jgi:hypothetical protein
VGVRKQETRFLPSAFQLDDKTGEKMGQEVFHRASNLGHIKNLGVGDEKGALEKVPVRVGKGLQSGLPTLHDTGVGRFGFFEKL